MWKGNFDIKVWRMNSSNCLPLWGSLWCPTASKRIQKCLVADWQLQIFGLLPIRRGTLFNFYSSSHPQERGSRRMLIPVVQGCGYPLLPFSPYLILTPSLTSGVTHLIWKWVQLSLSAVDNWELNVPSGQALVFHHHLTCRRVQASPLRHNIQVADLRRSQAPHYR